MIIRSLAARSRPALGLAWLWACVACSDCPVDPNAPRTERYIISEARAAEIMAAEDGGAGPTCEQECIASTRWYGGSVSVCSLTSPADGGVTLTCLFTGPFCD